MALFGLQIYPAFYLTTPLPVTILRAAHGLDRVILSIESWSTNRVAEDLCI